MTSVLTQAKKGDITLNNFISLLVEHFHLLVFIYYCIACYPKSEASTTIFSFSLLVLVVDGLGWLVPFGPCRLAVFWQLSLELPGGLLSLPWLLLKPAPPVTVPRLAWVFSQQGTQILPWLSLWKGQLPFGFPCCHVDIHSLLIFWFPKRGWNSNFKWNLVILVIGQWSTF